MARLLAALALALSLGCGRSAIFIGELPPNDAGVDAGPPPAAFDAGSCSAMARAAKAGTQLWSVFVDGGPNDTGIPTIVNGPLAADPSGGTYYALAPYSIEGSNFSAANPSLVFALDDCGQIRWQTTVAYGPPGVYSWNQALFAAGRLLLIGVPGVWAFDAQTGIEAWRADLLGYIDDGGLGVPPYSNSLQVAVTGPAAATADGTLYVIVANGPDGFLLAVDHTGQARTLAQLPNLFEIGYPALSLGELIVDSEGNLMLAGGGGVGQGADQYGMARFAPSGAPLPTLFIPDWAAGIFLAGGNGIVVGDNLSIVATDGGLLDADTNSSVPVFLTSWGRATVIEGDGGLVSIGLDQSPLQIYLGRFDATGHSLWTAPLPGQAVAGPLLGDDATAYVVTSDADGGRVAAWSYDLASGAPSELGDEGWQGSRLGQEPFFYPPIVWAQLTASAELVFNDGNTVFAVATGGHGPATDSPWPTPLGQPDQCEAVKGF